MTLVEFSDLECSACRSYQPVIDGLRSKYGASIAVVFVHYPLTRIHRFAMPAARAAECAAEQGRFASFSSLVYSKQDSIGLKPWASYALESMVPDVERFSDCSAATGPVERILKGMEQGERIEVTGTPTIALNGLRFFDVPSREVLEATIDSILRVARTSGGSGY